MTERGQCPSTTRRAMRLDMPWRASSRRCEVKTHLHRGYALADARKSVSATGQLSACLWKLDAVRTTTGLSLSVMEMDFAVLERAGVRLVICLHTEVDPPAPEWEHTLRELGALMASAPATQQLRMLVVTGGGGPDAKQRAQLRDVWGEHAIKVALLVPGLGNPIKRGLVTALNWINPALAVFTPERFPNALKYLDLQEELPSIWHELCGLQGKLTPVRTLATIAQTCKLALN